MASSKATDRQNTVRIEDVLLAVLGLIAGPLLWWISQTWQQNTTATSMQTLEYWIALICGFMGVALSTTWIIFALAGLGFAVALRTQHKIIGYWAGLFTPKFLQRIIISVLGLQLTLGSQAFATEELPAPSSEVSSTDAETPFMPQIAKLPAEDNQELTLEPSETEPTVQPTEEPSTTMPSHNTPSSSVSPQPRQSSTISPEATAAPDADVKVSEPQDTPVPRQTSSMPVIEDSEHEVADQAPNQPGIPEAFLPEKSPPSPYIAMPDSNRSSEDPTLVVLEGDNLWDIAHQELGADATLTQVDDRWRQWWQHNRGVIGNDPHVLAPGMVLTAPPFSS